MLIKFYQIIIYFISSLAWLFYGIISKDLYIVCPYAIGIIMSLLQIIINCERKYPLIDEKNLITSIGIESIGK